MSVERTGPEPEDVLFDSVSADEREACLIFELSRESPSLRRVFENGWHTTDPWNLPDEAPAFLGRGQTKEAHAAVLRKASLKRDLTDQDPEMLAHLHWSLFSQDWGRLLAWNPFDDWVDENVGWSLFSEGDFIDLFGFVAKLRTLRDPISGYLWNQFSASTQEVLTSVTSTPEQQKSALVEALNNILKGVLYETARFASVTLSPETQALKSQDPHGTDLIRLNRLLLEDAYPLEIAKSQNIERIGANIELVGDPPTKTPYFLSTPYQKLPKGRLAKRPAASLIQVMPLNFWPTSGLRSPVTTSDSALFSFLIRFGGHTDKELAEAFEKLAGELRPKQFKIERRRPSGTGAPERRAASWLRRLGVCRLFAHFPRLQSVPQEFRNIWYRSSTEMRENCISLDGLFHERLQFLDEGEKPECLAECERKGRFTVKSGRPRKL